MLDVVAKRGWYFLFSGLLILPGLLSMILPPGWASGNSGLNPGIDFTSGAVLQVSFESAVTEQQIQDRMGRLGHPEALIQRVGRTSYFIRTKQLQEAFGDDISERSG